MKHIHGRMAAIAAMLAGALSTHAQWNNDSTEYESFGRYRLGGYGEMVAAFKNYGINRFNGTTTGNSDLKRNTISIPRFVIAGDYKFSRHWMLGAEIEFESGGTGSALELENTENGEYETEVEKGGSERKYAASVDWLCDASFASRALNVTVTEVPLNAQVRDGWFKLYLSDIGLLSAMYGTETKGLLYSGRLKGNAKGGLYENMIAGMLDRKGIPLYYFKTMDGTREIEFTIERDGGIVPVEVKASNGATISLNEALENRQVPYGYKFIDGNVGVSGKKITLPHYMAMFL